MLIVIIDNGLFVMKILLKKIALIATAAALVLGLSQVAYAANQPGKTSMLSVVSAQKGHVYKATTGYKLTLKGVDSRTLYFSDRPKRIAFVVPTTHFISQWGHYFKGDNPNGALVHADLMYQKNKSEIPAAIELSDPKWINSHTLQFDVTSLNGQAIKTGRLIKPVLFVDNLLIEKYSY